MFFITGDAMAGWASTGVAGFIGLLISDAADSKARAIQQALEADIKVLQELNAALTSPAVEATEDGPVGIAEEAIYKDLGQDESVIIAMDADNAGISLFGPNGY